MARLLLIAACLVALPFGASAQGSRETLFGEADAARRQAQAADAGTLAPDAFERGTDAYARADRDFERGRDAERVGSRADEAAEAFREAAERARRAAEALAPMIEAREDAAAASAETFASELWREAGAELDSAVRRLHRGDADRARGHADEAEALYREAELAAIKARHLSRARAMIAEARQADVGRHAPRTLSDARELLARAEAALEEDRSDSAPARRLAERAADEARRAARLAEQIRGIEDEGRPLEEVILEYRAPLARVAAAAGLDEHLGDEPDRVADALVEHLEGLRESRRETAAELERSRTRIVELEEEIRELDEQLGGVSEERVALIRRLEADARTRERFETVERLFQPDEAEVVRQGEELVLRVVGLTFPSGRAEIDESDRGLLEKIARAIDTFPGSRVSVEGHTDSAGAADTNMTLSRRRAEAVAGHLSEEHGIAARRIRAVGFGETRPVANNETERGRARNRRIDVRITPGG